MSKTDYRLYITGFMELINGVVRVEDEGTMTCLNDFIFFFYMGTIHSRRLVGLALFQTIKLKWDRGDISHS